MAALSATMRPAPRFLLLVDVCFQKSRLNFRDTSNVKVLTRCLHSCRRIVRPAVRHGLLRFRPNVVPLLRVSEGWRYNTTVAADTFDRGAADDEYLPAPPLPHIPDQVDISSSLNALGEPTLSSLGLCNWTPAGLVQGCLEFLHVSLNLPWWGSIAVGVVILRLVLFPLIVVSQRNMMHMSNHMPHLTLLHQKFTNAQRSNNIMEAARLAHDIQSYNEKYNIKPIRNFLMPMVQTPIFLSVFFGIRKMTELPVESMKDGGLFWFTDLTVADPFYILPVITMATMSLIIEVGADGMKTGAMANNAKWIMRALPIVFFPFVSHFPTAMVCYWCTSNTISLIQTSILRLPAVRAYFKIPKPIIRDKSEQPPKLGFVEGFRETMHNSRVIAELQNRERSDAVRFKEAGTGPLVKTYKYDPTKHKPDTTPPMSAKQKTR